MADNKTLPPTGTGTANIVVATDEIAGVDYQYVKLVDGAADSTAKIGGDASNGLDVDVTRLPALVAGTANIGDVDVLTVPTDPFGANADAASATGSISAKLRLMAAAAATAPTGTLSNVSGSASSVTLLASNAARKGATIWNDSAAILYVKLGATASATSCTVKLIADAYFEVPFGYTGIIDGIWASATGSARVTEIT